MPFKKVINLFNQFVCYIFPVFGKQLLYERSVCHQRNSIQMHHAYTLIKRSGWAIEYIHHDMSLTSGKNEKRVPTMLHLCPQYRFHISFSIGTYLLKLVNSYNTGFIRLFQISENLFQSSLCCMNIPQTYIKNRLSRHAVQLESCTQRRNNRKEIIYKPPSFRFQFLKNLFPQSKYKFT